MAILCGSSWPRAQPDCAGCLCLSYGRLGPSDPACMATVCKCVLRVRRRAQENSDVLGGCGKERAMIRTELLRRMRQDNAIVRMLLPRVPNPPQAAAAA